MNQNLLFGAALGLAAPWKVVCSGLEDGGEESKFLDGDIEVEGGALMACPCCGRLCPLSDHEVKRWRHLNFWQHATYLSAQVPRVECPEHRVRQVAVPWARTESGFTLMFEAFVMALPGDARGGGGGTGGRTRHAPVANGAAGWGRCVQGGMHRRDSHAQRAVLRDGGDGNRSRQRAAGAAPVHDSGAEAPRAWASLWRRWLRMEPMPGR